METIYKIKVRSNPNPKELYPSERRYKSTTIVGLSLMFGHLFIFSIVMAALLTQKISTSCENNQEMSSEKNSNSTQDDLVNFSQEDFGNNSTEEDLGDYSKESTETEIIGEDTILIKEETNKTAEEIEEKRFIERIEKDLLDIKQDDHYFINIKSLICAACFILALSTCICCITGYLASRHWYIDHNINLFFLSTCFSTLTSALALLLFTLYLVNDYNALTSGSKPGNTISVAINMILFSLAILLLSVISSKIAYKGMKNNYPDDIISKGGIITITTNIKGCKQPVLPPAIMTNFPKTGKIAKYLPKKQDDNLPKAESNLEYQQRVDTFLNGMPESNGSEKN